MTDREQFIDSLRETAETLGYKLVLLPAHDSDDSPAEITPGGRTLAALVLALHGDKPEEIIEHPWLKGSSDVFLMADPPELEHIDLPFMATSPPPRREPPLSLLFPLPPSPMLTILP